MKSIIFLVAVIAARCSSETPLTFYAGTGNESSFNELTTTCLDKYQQQTFMKSPPKVLEPFIGCEHLDLAPTSLQPMTQIDCYYLIDNAQRLLTLIEDFPSTPLGAFRSNARLNLVQMTKLVVHQANTDMLADEANEEQSQQLVLGILKLKGQFQLRFPSDANAPAWDRFLAKHADSVKAIDTKLAPNLKLLIDYMNANYANFTNQPEVINEFTALYENVFDAYYKNETSEELDNLEPDAWAMLFDVMKSLNKQSIGYATLSRFNRTTFFAVNAVRMAIATGSFLVKFLSDIKLLLEQPANVSVADSKEFLAGIVRRFDVAIELILREGDFNQSDEFSVDDVNLFCNGVLTQFFMEMVNDETLLKNHPDAIADIKQRFDPAIAVISERVFPKDAFESALGAPYAEFSPLRGAQFLEFQIINGDEKIDEIDLTADTDDEAATENKISEFAWTINALLHYASKFKIEKHFTMEARLLKALKAMCAVYSKLIDPTTIESLAFEGFSESFQRIYGL